MTASTQGELGAPELVPCTLRDMIRYFLRLGTLGFGGPIALAGYMQRDLVEQRRWISKQDYVEGLALAQLSPGPLAAQLATRYGGTNARPGAVAAVEWHPSHAASPNATTGAREEAGEGRPSEVAERVYQ